MNNIYSLQDHTHAYNQVGGGNNRTLKSGTHTSASAARLSRPVGTAMAGDKAFDKNGIHTTTEVHVKVENVPSDSERESVEGGGVYDGGFDRRHVARGQGLSRSNCKSKSDDELPLSPQELVVGKVRS